MLQVPSGFCRDEVWTRRPARCRGNQPQTTDRCHSAGVVCHWVCSDHGVVYTFTVSDNTSSFIFILLQNQSPPHLHTHHALYTKQYERTMPEWLSEVISLCSCWWRQDCRRRSHARHYVSEKHAASCYPSESGTVSYLLCFQKEKSEFFRLVWT